MTDDQTTSWIFLATAIASQTGPTDFDSISNIADGINHAIPTHKELQTSLTWLTNNELVIKNGNKYSLTEKGKIDYDMASQQTSTLLKIWDNLEADLKKYRT
jgi:predicted transcriptional regulator